MFMARDKGPAPSVLETDGHGQKYIHPAQLISFEEVYIMNAYCLLGHVTRQCFDDTSGEKKGTRPGSVISPGTALSHHVNYVTSKTPKAQMAQSDET
jgi:hypothetical protein